jgi:cystathionine beta-lyase/cystathionine gamma-synthase
MGTLPAWDLETVLVHSGIAKSITPSTGIPTIPPIYASSTFIYENPDALDQSFEGKNPEGEAAFVYTRQGNPSTHIIEEVLAHSEGGVGAVSFGSGMAAIHAALLAAGLVPGTKLVTSHQLFGSTSSLLQKVFAPLDIRIISLNLGGPDAGEIIHAEQPDAVFVESISNPLAQVVNIPAVCKAAQETGAISIVDNTIASPYIFQPIKYGCDLVVHSMTKYISGHGDSTGGIVISAKNALLDQLSLYHSLMGAILSPFESHLLLRGLRTLSLRMERQCTNALKIAAFLNQHPAIAHVHFTGLPTNPQHELANQMFGSKYYGALLAFELKQQSKANVYQFINRLQLWLYATTLGDACSLVGYPPVSSHRTLTEVERQQRGITEGIIRLSVGIEHIDDLLADLEQSLCF